MIAISGYRPYFCIIVRKAGVFLNCLSWSENFFAKAIFLVKNADEK